MPDIFLSYNREDQARAKAFTEAFEEQGLSVWWDSELKSGEAYDEVTENALRTARAVVVLWSPRSVASRWVKSEATLADRNKTLVPCMIEPCERPIMFELVQTAELSHWRGDPTDRAWQTFLADVRRFIARGPVVAPALSAAQTSRPPERGGPPSLGVMPFANRSSLAEDDAFAQALVEDIVAALTRSPDIKVLAASASASFHRQGMDLRDVGRELGVRYLLEGNVRRSGAMLRVTAQLAEAETGAILWTEKFDRLLADAAALEDELVAEIAAHLHIRVRTLEGERVLTTAMNLTVRDLLMRAEERYFNNATEGLADARRAVSIDPDNALAHAVLASGIVFLALDTGCMDAAMREEAVAEARRAIALEARDTAPLWRSAFALAYAGHVDEAERHVNRVLGAAPTHQMAYFVRAATGLLRGDYERVIRDLDTWEKLSPGSRMRHVTLIFRAAAHAGSGRFPEALAAIDESYDINPHYAQALGPRVALKQMAGQVSEARVAIKDLRRVEPSALPDRFTGRHDLMITPTLAASLNAAFLEAWNDGV